jgi:hypothetical protein
MNKIQTIVFVIIVIIGAIYTLSIFGNDIEINILPKNEIPPPLSDLFPDRPNGPHQKFVSEESCLTCHEESISFPGIGSSPKIAHELRKNCTSCHLLPSEQI